MLHTRRHLHDVMTASINDVVSETPCESDIVEKVVEKMTTVQTILSISFVWVHCLHRSDYRR